MQRKILSPALRKTRRIAHRVIIGLSIATLAIRLLDPGISAFSMIFQILTWFIFLAHATFYTRMVYDVRNVWRYHRDEWAIILFWNPLTFSVNGPPLSVELIQRIVEHAALVSQFLGLLAHFWIIARSFRSQWGKHPLFCAVLCVVSITVLIGALLRKYEPATFLDWPVTLWFCLETISTVGYGDVVPHTLSARFLSFVLILFGGGVHGVLLAFVGQKLIDIVEWRHPVHRKRDLRKSASSPTTEELLVELIQRVDTLQRRLDEQHKNQRLDQSNSDDQ